MTTTTSVKTTTTVDYTNASSIRVEIKQDMPEYGLTAGQIVYLVRSSKDDGTYYICTWSYEQIRWTCPCRATIHNCRHARICSSKSHKHCERVKATEQVTAKASVKKDWLKTELEEICKQVEAELQAEREQKASQQKDRSTALLHSNTSRAFSLLKQ